MKYKNLIFLILSILIFLISPDNLFGQIKDGNYYCEKPTELLGLSFYQNNLFRYYRKLEINTIKKQDSLISNTQIIEKGIGTYEIVNSVLFLTFDSYNSRDKKYEKSQLDLKQANNITSELVYIENKNMKYEIVFITCDSLILKPISEYEIPTQDYLFIPSNLRIKELCKEIELKIIPIDSINKKGYIFADSRPQFIGVPSDFRQYLFQHFRYTNYYDNRGYFLIYYIIESDGSINNIYIKNSRDEDFLLEALIFLKSTSGKWNPAIIDGKKVNYRKTMMFHAYPQCGATFIDY